MKHKKSKKLSRICLRLLPHDKQRIEQAATISCMSISSFMIANSLLAADEIEEQKQDGTYDEEQWREFYDELVKPRKLN